MNYKIIKNFCPETRKSVLYLVLILVVNLLKKIIGFPLFRGSLLIVKIIFMTWHNFCSLINITFIIFLQFILLGGYLL